MTTQLPDFCT